MINIILLILKIILLTILSLLGLAILLILIVVFAPIRYKADICYKESAIVKAKVKYLFVSANIYYNQQGNKLEQVIRIFGFRIGKKRKKADKKTSEMDKIEEEEIDFETNLGTDINREDNEIPLIKVPEIETGMENETRSENEFESEDNKDSSLSYDIEEEDKKKKRKKKQEKNKAGLKERWEEIKKKYKRFKKFWNLECTTKAKAYIKKYIFGALKHLLPRKIKGYVRYGFEDPSTTGMVTGYLSLMPFMYQKGFYPQPDFDNKIIEADVKAKGHFFIGYFIRIAFKPCIWKTLFAAKKFIG